MISSPVHSQNSPSNEKQWSRRVPMPLFCLNLLLVVAFKAHDANKRFFFRTSFLLSPLFQIDIELESWPSTPGC